MNGKILVVDDEKLNRLVVQQILTKEGFEVLEADDGESGLSLAAEEKPDLILLDIMMPGMDGYEVCTRLKQHKVTKRIPVIMLTALSQRKDIEKGVEAGANEFITKPFDAAELLLRIRSLLKIHELHTFFDSHEKLFHRFEALTDYLVENPETHENDYELILRSMLEENIEKPNPPENAPKSAFLSLKLSNHSIPGALYYREGENLVKKDFGTKAPVISEKDIEPVSIRHGKILLSNWQTLSESPYEYSRTLPRVLVQLAGKVKNFIYYSDEVVTVIFFNFQREIKPFDVSWFHHLVYYNKTLLLILQKIKEKELEYEALANSLSQIAEIKDNSKGKHTRIRRVCDLMCGRIETSEGFRSQLLDGVSLFDLGKLLIDQKILFKQESLSESEWELIRRIPNYVQTVIGDNPRMAVVKEITSGINEHWDGTGYPNKRKGEEIPLSARIVSLANVYDSLRCDRPYREGFSHSEALDILNKGDERVKPGHFDPKLLDVFNQIAPEIEEFYHSHL